MLLCPSYILFFTRLASVPGPLLNLTQRGNSTLHTDFEPSVIRPFLKESPTRKGLLRRLLIKDRITDIGTLSSSIYTLLAMSPCALDGNFVSWHCAFVGTSQSAKTTRAPVVPK